MYMAMHDRARVERNTICTYGRTHTPMHMVMHDRVHVERNMIRTYGRPTYIQKDGGDGGRRPNKTVGRGWSVGRAHQKILDETSPYF